MKSKQTGCRRTKIVFTIGPATQGPDMLDAVIRAGADVCRINMAHATHDWTRQVCNAVREASERTGRDIAIMMDVKGPEIRTGDVATPMELKPGEVFDFTVKPRSDGAHGEEVRSVDVNYRNLVNDIRVGDTVLVDNGLIRFEVLEKNDARIRCRVQIPGKLGSRRHINLPGVRVNLPALTEKDMGDLQVAAECAVDFIALSFVREPADIEKLRSVLDDLRSSAHIIAKIEDQQAISNLEGIVKACDGLMVARGDLGIECPFEDLPIIQRRAVRTCLTYGKPVIIATHMLESMITSPLPTRAEVSDVSNAVYEQADCVMLSGETTVGKYPVECIEAFDRIARRIERDKDVAHHVQTVLGSDQAKMLRSAVSMANELDAAGIVVFTRRGYVAQGVAALRPKEAPIYAFTNSRLTFRQMRLLRGVEPFLMNFGAEPELTVQKAIGLLYQQGYVKIGDKVVVVSDILASDRLINSIQLRNVD
ncbi:pyruvate kinase [Opitutales bacterium ASA1]|uniref:pyruvate kinase n=1 Tax=Congregicoccus parvus TaxID=3081749 RepID=UPI002B2DC52C|nr:pyruvate kinase [Opitutales bacterium ASA1]